MGIQDFTPHRKVRVPIESDGVDVAGSGDGDALRLRAVSEPVDTTSCDRVALCLQESTGNVGGDLFAIGRICAVACISASVCEYCALCVD